MSRIWIGFAVCMLGIVSLSSASEPIRVGTFDVDATPPVGSPLAYDPMKEVVMPLHCTGVVLIGDDAPIVLCVVDWIGIGNDGNRVFRTKLAEAAGTTADRVALHTVHQHDAPRLDFSAEAILQEHDAGGIMFNVEHARSVIDAAASAVTQAKANAVPITHIGLGEGKVEEVASNRRILGEDGKVAWTRWTSGAKEPRNREAPVGVIDPMLKSIVFFQGEKPVANLTYYATHPQSYYRTGGANPDFPGIARETREEVTDTPHMHFTGAAGNIGAGKWNDGSTPYRQILADRLAEGMKQAWDTMKRTEVSAADLRWGVVPAHLPLGAHVVAEQLEKQLADPNVAADKKPAAAKALAWARRCADGDTVDIQCLHIGNARVLHMPGELCVEYQLAAQKLRPDLFVAMAAYGDYAMGYVCPKIAYSQGGYEASERASRVAPEVETVLMDAMRDLLKD